MRRKIFVIFFLMGKTLFSQSFDENFLSPKYQRNNIIKKTEESTRNLFLLYQTGRYPYLAQESKLLSTFLRLKKYNLIRLFAFKFNLTKNILRWLLSRKSPLLQLYDLYKLLFICKISLKNDKMSAI